MIKILRFWASQVRKGLVNVLTNKLKSSLLNENSGKINLYIKLGFLSTRDFVLSSHNGETRTSLI